MAALATTRDIPRGQPYTAKNEWLSISFDGNGVLSTVVNAQTGATTHVQHEYMAYNPAVNDQPSGAYIFRPNITGLPPQHIAPPTVQVVEGECMTEIVQTYDWSNIVQVCRLIVLKGEGMVLYIPYLWECFCVPSRRMLENACGCVRSGTWFLIAVGGRP